ncbi:hypothetical protein FOZ61_006586 [Perkinsus olseni]|uniref:PPM-type phosphatase domain-containing protein n=1 Tax=Perkinsus olseni TaxID=32597 RepID=A0A7J6MAD6_PEROL|nr:hypothetical protein FOZ61_006586 [Perkinsus olseni]KAF4673883.1 hypothetical protein FOL46_006291 [Perkinsus olseni]
MSSTDAVSVAVAPDDRLKISTTDTGEEPSPPPTKRVRVSAEEESGKTAESPVAPTRPSSPVTAPEDSPIKFGSALPDGTPVYVEAGEGWWMCVVPGKDHWTFNPSLGSYFNAQTQALTTESVELALPNEAVEMSLAQSPEEGGSLKGRIKFYSPQRHFGYITVEGLLAEGGDEDDDDTSASQDDLYFNRRNLLDSTEIGKLDSGIPVTFDIAEDNGQYSAVNVKVRPEGDTGESPGAKSLTTTTGGDSSAEAAKGEEPDDDEEDGDEDDIEIDVWQNIQAHYGQRPNPQKGVALCEDRYLEKKRLPVASLLPEGADETYACGIIGGVLDGHGGQCCVEYVSQHLFRNIAAQLQNTARQRKKGGMNEVQKLEKFMRKGFQVTEHNFMSIFGRKRKDTSGCTACVVVFYGPNLDGELNLVTAHLGDTRAVLCRNGRAVQLTEDHKPDNEEERRRIEALPKGRVCQVQGIWRVVKQDLRGLQGLAVSRAFGDHQMKEPEPYVSADPEIVATPIDFDQDEFVVIATDGIWDKIDNQEAISYLRKYRALGKLDEGINDLLEIAEKRGSEDDKTVMVFSMDWRPSPEPPEEESEVDTEEDMELPPMTQDAIPAMTPDDDVTPDADSLPMETPSNAGILDDDIDDMFA